MKYEFVGCSVWLMDSTTGELTTLGSCPSPWCKLTSMYNSDGVSSRGHACVSNAFAFLTGLRLGRPLGLMLTTIIVLNRAAPGWPDAHNMSSLLSYARPVFGRHSSWRPVVSALTALLHISRASLGQL
jgi:hypothetical protein